MLIAEGWFFSSILKGKYQKFVEMLILVAMFCNQHEKYIKKESKQPML